MAHARRVVSGGLTILLLAQTTGCHSWKQTALPEPRSTPDSGHFRVTGRDGRQVEAGSVKLVGDTLYAYGRSAPDGARWATGEVTRLETRHGDALKTVGLVLLIVVPLGILFGLALESYGSALY